MKLGDIVYLHPKIKESQPPGRFMVLGVDGEHVLIIATPNQFFYRTSPCWVEKAELQERI